MVSPVVGKRFPALWLSSPQSRQLAMSVPGRWGGSERAMDGPRPRPEPWM